MTPQAAQNILTANFAQWVQALDLTVTEATHGHVLIRMPLVDDLLRVGGIVAGQALAALADTTMVLAAIAHAGDSRRTFATTDLHTQFLRPGTGTAIQCRGSVSRAGKSLVFARAEMHEEESGKLVATAAATFYAA